MLAAGELIACDTQTTVHNTATTAATPQFRFRLRTFTTVLLLALSRQCGSVHLEDRSQRCLLIHHPLRNHGGRGRRHRYSWRLQGSPSLALHRTSGETIRDIA